MSQENKDQVREAVGAFNRRDLDAYLALMEPDVELSPYERAVEGLGPYRGHGGVRRWWQESLATLPDLRAELDELRDLGDMVFARGRLRGVACAGPAQKAVHLSSGPCGWPLRCAIRALSGAGEDSWGAEKPEAVAA